MTQPDLGTPDEFEDGDDLPDEPSRFLPESFWQARPSLRHIRKAAQSRRAAPDAVLLEVLARVAALTHPRWRGPDDATLDVLGVVVAKSGRGKGTAKRVARDLVPGLDDRDGPTYTRDLGSGEGMVQCYFGWEEDPDNPKKRVQVQVRWGVLFSCDEGTTYLKLAERSGQTTGETLRKMIMGEMLGGTYGSQHNREIWLAPYTYRAAVMLSVQPEAFGGFLSEWRTGTPQRALWVPGIDPTAPDDKPVWPGPLRWKPDRDDLKASTQAKLPRLSLAADDRIASEIDAARAAALRGGSQGQYDSHRNLLRLKVAMLLAMLDGRLRAKLATTWEDWELAGMVLAASDEVRTRVLGALATDQAQRESERTGKAVRLATAVRAAERTADDNTVRVARRIQAYCQRHPGASNRKLRDSTTKDKDERAAFRPALGHAEAQGWVVQKEDGWHAP
jgi:hypothetical protein